MSHYLPSALILIVYCWPRHVMHECHTAYSAEKLADIHLKSQLVRCSYMIVVTLWIDVRTSYINRHLYVSLSILPCPRILDNGCGWWPLGSLARSLFLLRASIKLGIDYEATTCAATCSRGTFLVQLTGWVVVYHRSREDKNGGKLTPLQLWRAVITTITLQKWR